MQFQHKCASHLLGSNGPSSYVSEDLNTNLLVLKYKNGINSDFLTFKLQVNVCDLSQSRIWVTQSLQIYKWHIWVKECLISGQ